MKKTRILSFMASVVATVALLTGCSTENDFENGRDGLASLELSSVSSSDILTRAVIDGTTFPQTGEIGLFLFKDELAKTPYEESGYTNIKYAYNSSKNKWTASQSIKVGSTEGYLYGYYPYNAANTNVKAIPVTSSLNGNDVMYASHQEQPITDLTAANTSIKMNHALARVAIKVINNGYTGGANLSSIKFKGATIASSGTLNAIDGSITASKANEVALSVQAAEQPIATGDGTTYECLLVPSEIKDGRQDVYLYLTIDGQEKDLYLSGNNGVIFKPGVKSTVTITLSNTGIALKSVSINDWQTVKVGEHTVTVKTADGIAPSDILTKAYVDGNNVVIRAFSETGQHLKCTLSEGTFCPQSKTDKLVYTFTLSDIESDITATIGYANSLIVNVTSNNDVWGKASYKGDCYEGETITLVATNNEGKFEMWQDADRNTLSKDNPYTVTPLTTNLTVNAIFNDGIILPGEFTVNESGKKVKFSKGNLYYDYDKPEWKFEKYQYDFRTYQGNASCINGVYNANGDTPKNHWGLFGWVGNSSETFTTAPEMYGVSTRTAESDYGTGNENLKSDWGKVMGSTWYTLTVEEWTYLFNSRTNASSKFGYATVGGVNGLIILPDAFTDPKKNAGSNAFVPYDKIVGKYNDNVYTTGGNWEAMETAGAVFLPAAGYRDNGTTITGSSAQGRYWSSSSTENSDAYYVFFNPDAAINPRSSNFRYRGNCVRLVTESK